MSPGYDSYGIDSTTLSSDVLHKERLESDHLNYLFDPNFGYERRADSLKSPIPPGLNAKYRMEEKGHPRSQFDHNEFFMEGKPEDGVYFTTQRKITEDKLNEDISQNSSDDEKDTKKGAKLSSKSFGKKSMMSMKSEGFIPKRLRQPEVPPPIDVDKLIGSEPGSRKQSENEPDTA